MAVRIRESSIRTLMARKGIKTQIELAKLCDMNHISLNTLIKGRRKTISGTTIDRLCEILEAQPGDFLFYEPSVD